MILDLRRAAFMRERMYSPNAEEGDIPLSTIDFASHSAVQRGLLLPTLSDLPRSASRGAGIENATEEEVQMIRLEPP